MLGIAAVEGNGQSELLEAVTGMRAIAGGSVRIQGRAVAGLTPGQIRRLGLAHVPEDRLATGVSPEANLTENLIMGRHRDRRLTRFGFHLRKKEAERDAGELLQRYDIRAAGLDVPVGSLSGGNVQKVVIAREFSFDATALVIAQPTPGSGHRRDPIHPPAHFGETGSGLRRFAVLSGFGRAVPPVRPHHHAI